MIAGVDLVHPGLSGSVFFSVRSSRYMFVLALRHHNGNIESTKANAGQIFDCFFRNVEVCFIFNYLYRALPVCLCFE